MRWLSLDLLVDFGQVSPGLLLYREGYDVYQQVCINHDDYYKTYMTQVCNRKWSMRVKSDLQKY